MTATATATRTETADRLPAGPAWLGRPLRTTLGVLVGVAVVLVLVDQALVHLAPTGRDWDVLADLFDVSREANVPSTWNAWLLVALSLSCAAVAGLVRATRRGWVLAAVLAAGLAADETLQGHERLRSVGSRLAAELPVSLPTFSWVLPGAVLALAGALVVWRWTRGLPAPTGTLLRLALLLYGVGALGVEAVSGWIAQNHGIGTAYRAAAGLEEGLEMVACSIAVVAVLRMIRVTGPGSSQDDRPCAVVPLERNALM